MSNPRKPRAREEPRPEGLFSPHVRIAAGLPPVDPRWYAAAERHMFDLCKRLAAGDNSAGFEALCVLLSAGAPAPLREWFFAAWTRYSNHEAGTLDEAFGLERRKWEHAAQAHNRETMRPRIVLGVCDLQRQGKPLDTAFAIVGEKLELVQKQRNGFTGTPRATHSAPWPAQYPLKLTKFSPP
jgi:hypothetical protein